MKCSKAYKYFEHSLKNKLNQENISEFNSHLKDCEQCGKIFNEINATYNSVELLNLSQNNSPYFFSRLMATIENRKEQQISVVAKFKPAIITAWFLFAFVFGITIGSNLIESIKTDNYSSSSAANNDDSFLDIFNLSEVDKESFEYLLLQ